MKKLPLSRRSPKERHGFSLILSLAVMSMVLMTVISLTAFLTLSLKTSDAFLKRSLARNNAILAAKIALGDLQLNMGPDRRVSGTGANYEQHAGKAETQKNPQWVGVWNTYNTESRASSGVAEPYFGFLKDNKEEYMTDSRNNKNTGKYEQPKVRSWLVSRRKKDLDAGEDFGPKTANEDDWVALLNYWNRSNEKKQVTAPYVPTLDKSAGAETGGFAYWVSDESQKVRINTADPYRDKEPPTKEGFYRMMLPASVNIATAETRDASGARETPYVKFHDPKENLAKMFPDVFDLESASRLEFGSTQEKRSVFLKNNFLDFTTSSEGLLVNTIRGGFLSDMSAFLQSGTSGIGNDSKNSLYGLLDGDQIVRSSKYVNCSPCFGVLKSWYDLRTKEIAPKNPQVAVVPPAPGDYPSYPGVKQFKTQPLTPVLVEAIVAQTFAVDDPSLAKDDDVYSLRSYVYPRVVLWNPYNVTLQPTSYVVKIASMTWWFAGIRNVNTTPTNPGKSVRHEKMFGAVGTLPNDDAKINFLFALEAFAIPPGEAVVFSPQGIAELESGWDKNKLYATSKPFTGAFKSKVTWKIDEFSVKKAKELAKAKGWVEGTGDLWGFIDQQLDYRVTPGQSQGSELWGAELRLNSGGTNFDALKPIQRVDISWGGEISLGGDNNTWENFPYAIDVRAPGLMTKSKIEELTQKDWGDNILPQRWQMGARMLQVADPAESYYDGGDGFPSPAKQVPYFNHNLRSPSVFRNMMAYCENWANNLPSCLYVWPGRESSRWSDETKSNRMRVFGNYYPASPFGKNSNWLAARSGSNKDLGRYVLFDIPCSEVPILSLATFRHAMLSPFVWHPTYVIGNGNASIYAESNKTVPDAVKKTVFPNGFYAASPVLGSKGSGAWTTPDGFKRILDGMQNDRFIINDLSYVANREIFDNYFLSTLVSGDESKSNWDCVSPLPNARLKLNHAKKNVLSESNDIKDDLNKMYHRSASILVNEGAFNVNSTSVEAWKAFLCSTLNIPRYLMGNTKAAGNLVAFSTPSFPYDKNGEPTKDLKSAGMWCGFRALKPDGTDKTSLNTLAEKIVEEVKRRAPFMSLSDFINRRLIGKDAVISGYADEAFHTTGFEEDALRGTLDAAINKAGANEFSFNHSIGSGQFADEIDKAQYGGGMGARKMFSSAQAMTKYQTEGAPGYLTQGEMLQALAPAMTVRGDTFTVRTYGDCRNPFTGQVESKAYLEITAQRLPDYTDGANEAAMPPLARESRKVDIVNENTKLTAANKVFGRKFVITSARWISANDL